MKKNILFCILSLVMAGLCACDKEPVTPTPTPDPEPTAKGNDIVVYEANEKLFASTNCLKAVDARLDEIEALGVNVLWLMPIHPVGGEKSVYSPYCVQDFKAIHPDYGTIDDLKTLVQHAHAKGMKVMLDWIANHTAWDHAWYKEHQQDGWYTSPTGDEQNWTDVVPLNFNNRQVRDAMTDAMTYWVREADVDGFRCDFAQGVPDDYWQEAISAIRAIKPEAIMLAETSRTQLYDAGFDWMYSWSYLASVQDLYSKGSLASLYNVSDSEFGKTPAGKARLRYITNHDACSEKANASLYTNADGMLAAACVTYFLGGIPLIYSSQEVGYMQKIDFCCTPAQSVKMDWNSNPDILRKMKQLMAVYHRTAALRGGELDRTSQNVKVASLCYASGEGTLLVLVNTTNASLRYTLPMAMQGKSVQDLLSDETLSLGREIELGAFEYRIFSF